MDAQNLHPILQPTCEDMHTEFPCLYFISTLSMTLPSSSAKRYFLVPSSFDTCTSSFFNEMSIALSFNTCMNFLKYWSSHQSFPHASHESTHISASHGISFPPSDMINSVSSSIFIDLMSVSCSFICSILFFIKSAFNYCFIILLIRTNLYLLIHDLL